MPNNTTPIISDADRREFDNLWDRLSGYIIYHTRGELAAAQHAAWVIFKAMKQKSTNNPKPS